MSEANYKLLHPTHGLKIMFYKNDDLHALCEEPCDGLEKYSRSYFVSYFSKNQTIMMSPRRKLFK